MVLLPTPPGRSPPGRPPPPRWPLKWVVCILLEYILVTYYVGFSWLCIDCRHATYTHPIGRHSPSGETPSRDGHWSGGYASYWTGFLLHIMLDSVDCVWTVYVHTETDGICLNFPTGSVSVSVWYGPRGIFCTIEWQNVNIYIFKRVAVHLGEHISVKNSISLDQIKIFQFCLEIWHLWRLPHP